MSETKSPKFYSIEGEIGAGKTEVINGLVEKLREKGIKVCLIPEPVTHWETTGVLKLFYSDMARYGYSFQTFVFATRILEIAKTVKANPDAEVYILERSPLTDPIFMELQRDSVDPVEMTMYGYWCDAWRQFCPIDFSQLQIIYLKTSLSVCMKRVAKRARPGEEVSSKVESSKEEPASDKSASDKSASDRSASDRSARDRSASDRSASDKSASDKSASDESASDKSASDEPPAKKASGGVSLAYQTRLREAHEAYFFNRGREKFPHMKKSPITAPIIEIESYWANKNFKNSGPMREAFFNTLLQQMGV